MNAQLPSALPGYAAILWFLLGILCSTSAVAQLEAISVSNDVHWNAGSTTINDEGARRVTLPSTVTTFDLGTLPANADVTAIELAEGGLRIFALDTFVDFGNDVTTGPEDVVAWNGSSFSLYFDGSSAGVPLGTSIDAVARVIFGGEPRTALSFDVSVSLPGPLTVDDEDLVVWTGSAWSMYFDGSANGVPATLDIDGFDHDLLSGTFYFSFDTSGKLSTVNFDDEDVVALNGSSWSLVFDASANLDPTFAAGDLDGLSIDTVYFFSDGFESGLMFP